jgi:hypothetical protein
MFCMGGFHLGCEVGVSTRRRWGVSVMPDWGLAGLLTRSQSLAVPVTTLPKLSGRRGSDAALWLGRRRDIGLSGDHEESAMQRGRIRFSRARGFQHWACRIRHLDVREVRPWRSRWIIAT